MFEINSLQSTQYFISWGEITKFTEEWDVSDLKSVVLFHSKGTTETSLMRQENGPQSCLHILFSKYAEHCIH